MLSLSLSYPVYYIYMVTGRCFVDSPFRGHRGRNRIFHSAIATITVRIVFSDKKINRLLRRVVDSMKPCFHTFMMRKQGLNHKNYFFHEAGSRRHSLRVSSSSG